MVSLLSTCQVSGGVPVIVYYCSYQLIVADLYAEPLTVLSARVESKFLIAAIKMPKTFIHK